MDAIEATPAEKKAAAEATKGENLAGLLKMDELTLEIGFQLIPLVDEKQGGQMLNRVRGLRRHLATELGFIVPPVHITDNLRLKPREYVVSLRGIEIGRWQTEGNCVLAVNGDPKARPIAGHGDDGAGVRRGGAMDRSRRWRSRRWPRATRWWIRRR